MSDITQFITADLLAKVSTLSAAQLQQWVDPIKKTCLRYNIINVRRVAAFISQQAHEGGFKVNNSRENLNYSAQRMSEVWPGRYSTTRTKPYSPNALAKSLEHNDHALANNVYANRLGNGPPESGDGFRFRGGAAGQLTGRTNWTNFAAVVGKSLDDAIDYACITAEGSVASFGWYWDRNHINALADTPGINDETIAINGGIIGLDDRKAKFDALVAQLIQLGA